MRRYWLPEKSFSPDSIEITGDEFHHIIEVCRQEEGSRFEVLGAPQKALLVEIQEVSKKKALAKVISTREIKDLPRPHIKLAISVPRFQVMDSVVEKAVEMGVHSVVPFFSDYSFVRKNSSLPESKVERWQKIVKSSTQQCGRGEMMTLEPACDLAVLGSKINQNPEVMGLFAYEGNAAASISKYLRARKSTEIKEIWLFVGSEGGFSHREVELFASWGLNSVTLGDQILRVETACTALVAILKYEFGMMGD